jgi:hypothetical protein
VTEIICIYPSSLEPSITFSPALSGGYVEGSSLNVVLAVSSYFTSYNVTMVTSSGNTSVLSSNVTGTKTVPVPSVSTLVNGITAKV